MATQPVLPTTDWQLIADPWTDFNASSNYDIPLEWAATSTNTPPVSVGHLVRMDAGVSRQIVGGGYVWMRAIRQPIALLAVSTWPGQTVRSDSLAIAGLPANTTLYSQTYDLGLHRKPVIATAVKYGLPSTGSYVLFYESDDGVLLSYCEKAAAEGAAVSYDTGGGIYASCRPTQRYLRLCYWVGPTVQIAGSTLRFAIHPGV